MFDVLGIPESWGLAILGILSGVGGWFGNLLMRKLFPPKPERPQQKLVYHHVFADLDMLEQWAMHRYTQPDPGRTLVAREMVVHKIRVWRPLLQAFAEQIDFCYGGCKSAKQPQCNKVYNTAIKMLLDGMKAYTDWHLNPVVVSIDGKKTYSATDKATMDIYVQKFQQWHASREDMVSQMSKVIGESPLYDNCVERARDILTIYQSAFVYLRSDMDNSLRELNGELTDKRFLGHVLSKNH